MCNDNLNNMVLIRLKFIVKIFIATVKQKYDVIPTILVHFLHIKILNFNYYNELFVLLLYLIMNYSFFF